MTATAILRTCHVYGLYSSSGGGIRYVGQTTIGVARRVGHHVALALRETTKTHRDFWIRKVIASGDNVKWVVLQECAVWNTDEIKWIKKLKNDGASLTNATRGGEGMLNAPQELRQRISNKIKALWEDQEYRDRMKRAHAGVEWSESRRLACEKTAPEVRSTRAKAGREKLSQDQRSKISSDAAIKLWAQKRADRTSQGEHCNSAKLNADSVREIRLMLSQGLTKRAIAGKFSVSSSTISKITFGETWAHVI